MHYFRRSLPEGNARLIIRKSQQKLLFSHERLKPCQRLAKAVPGVEKLRKRKPGYAGMSRVAKVLAYTVKKADAVPVNSLAVKEGPVQAAAIALSV